MMNKSSPSIRYVLFCFVPTQASFQAMSTSVEKVSPFTTYLPLYESIDRNATSRSPHVVGTERPSAVMIAKARPAGNKAK